MKMKKKKKKELPEQTKKKREMLKWRWLKPTTSGGPLAVPLPPQQAGMRPRRWGTSLRGETRQCAPSL